MQSNLEHHTHEFESFINSDSQILILGSFPSVKSRETAFYYGHPRNRFWKVIQNVFDDFEIELDSIQNKKFFLKKHRIALYDSIESCDIKGSSDSSIKNVQPSDIVSLIRNTKINRIFTNGKTAEKYFLKYQPQNLIDIMTCLPSTSPANAVYTLEKLVSIWKSEILE